MANQLNTFHFENHPIRTIERENQIWFIAQDICDNLNIQNVTQALQKLDNDERSMFNIGRQGNVNIVNESGMYTLILRSRDAVTKGSASHRFRKWVTSEVLPTIRKTGSYSLTINPQQQQIIKQAVKGRAYRTGEHYQVIYAKLYEQFKIPRYQELPASQFDSAIEFLGGISAKQAALTSDELCDFAWLVKAAEKMRFELEEIEPALRTLKSERAIKIYTMSREYRNTISHCKSIVQQKMQTTRIDRTDLNWQRILPFIQ